MRSPEKDALADYISRLGSANALLESNRPDGATTHQSSQSHEPEL
jgi:hypothetical protein